MTTTFTGNKGFPLQGTGDNPNTWGSTLNTSLFTPLDLNIGGQLSLSVAGSADITLTSTQAQNGAYIFSGVLTGSINVIWPNTQANGAFVIKNSTSGAFTLTVKPSGGSGIAITQGETVTVWSNGSTAARGLTSGGLFGTQTAKTVLAGPTSGSATIPAFRALTGADGAGLVLISSAAASSSATVDFTSGISSTYDQYVIRFTNVLPATNNANLYLRISEAATFKTSGSYQWGWADVLSGTGTPSGNGSNADTVIQIAAAISNTTANGGVTGWVEFGGPSGTASQKMFNWKVGTAANGGGILSFSGSGAWTGDQGAIDGVRFLMSSGNIASGSFYLYGVAIS